MATSVVSQFTLINQNLTGTISIRAHLGIPEDNPQAVLIMADPKLDIIPILDRGKPKFKIRVSVRGNIGEMKKGLTVKNTENQAAKVIQDEIRKTYEEGMKLKADVFQLSQALYRKHPKIWHQYSVKGEFPLDPDSLQSIEVKVKLISSNKLRIK